MKIRCVTPEEFYNEQRRINETTALKKKCIRERAVELAARDNTTKPETKLSTYARVKRFFKKLLKNKFAIGKFYVEYNLYHNPTKGPRKLVIYRLPLVKEGRFSYPNPYFKVCSFEQALKTYTVHQVSPFPSRVRQYPPVKNK